jgi:hypothetical protein
VGEIQPSVDEIMKSSRVVDEIKVFSFKSQSHASSYIDFKKQFYSTRQW